MQFFVKRLGRNVFDVFEGRQWGSWSRLKIGRNGVFFVAGNSLHRGVYKALAANINPREEVQSVSL